MVVDGDGDDDDDVVDAGHCWWVYDVKNKLQCSGGRMREEGGPVSTDLFSKWQIMCSQDFLQIQRHYRYKYIYKTKIQIRPILEMTYHVYSSFSTTCYILSEKWYILSSHDLTLVLCTKTLFSYMYCIRQAVITCGSSSLCNIFKKVVLKAGMVWFLQQKCECSPMSDGRQSFKLA